LAEFRHFLREFRLGAGYSRRRKERRMKGDPRVIEYLNESLKNELTAVNQYWLHYRMLDNWGIKRLADYERHESIDEMKHADRLSERILFLDGLPNFQLLGRLRIGETVEEVLRADLELEREATGQLKDAIAHCESVRDFVSRELFVSILESEEEHIDFLERQFDMIARMGIQNYIQLQSEPAGE
jgi:bacterioferritin